MVSPITKLDRGGERSDEIPDGFKGNKSVFSVRPLRPGEQLPLIRFKNLPGLFRRNRWQALEKVDRRSQGKARMPTGPLEKNFLRRLLQPNGTSRLGAWRNKKDHGFDVFIRSFGHKFRCPDTSAVVPFIDRSVFAVRSQMDIPYRVCFSGICPYMVLIQLFNLPRQILQSRSDLPVLVPGKNYRYRFPLFVIPTMLWG